LLLISTPYAGKLWGVMSCFYISIIFLLILLLLICAYFLTGIIIFSLTIFEYVHYAHLLGGSTLSCHLKVTNWLIFDAFIEVRNNKNL